MVPDVPLMPSIQKTNPDPIKFGLDPDPIIFGPDPDPGLYG